MQFAELRRFAHVVMAHQAVEVERRRRAGVGLDRAHLRHLARHVGDVEQRAFGVLERCAFRQVDHHRHFRLVVERQQLHRHALGVEQHADGDGRHPDADEKGPGAPTRAQDRCREAAVNATEQAFAMRGLVLVYRHALRMQLEHQPRRDHHGDEEGEQHGGRSIGRDRRHVGAHQPGDEQHRQQRRDHGERGDDGGIADFRHAFDRRLQARAAVAHRPMAGDVFHHHDGVVDQDTDGEDEREQADPVDGVAHHVRGEHGEQDGGRDHHRRHQRLTPADREGDEHDDRHRRQAEMEQQFVGLLVGGLAVVARHGDADVLGHQPALDRLQAIEQLLGHHHRIGAGALGEGDADRRHAVPFAALFRLLEPHPVLLRARADHHLGDVAHIDRTAVAGGHQQHADIGNAGRASAQPPPRAWCRCRARCRPGTSGWPRAPC